MPARHAPHGRLLPQARIRGRNQTMELPPRSPARLCESSLWHVAVVGDLACSTPQVCHRVWIYPLVQRANAPIVALVRIASHSAPPRRSPVAFADQQATSPVHQGRALMLEASVPAEHIETPARVAPPLPFLAGQAHASTSSLASAVEAFSSCLLEAAWHVLHQRGMGGLAERLTGAVKIPRVFFGVNLLSLMAVYPACQSTRACTVLRRVADDQQ